MVVAKCHLGAKIFPKNGTIEKRSSRQSSGKTINIGWKARSKNSERLIQTDCILRHDFVCHPPPLFFILPSTILVIVFASDFMVFIISSSSSLEVLASPGLTFAWNVSKEMRIDFRGSIWPLNLADCSSKSPALSSMQFRPCTSSSSSSTLTTFFLRIPSTSSFALKVELISVAPSLRCLTWTRIWSEGCHCLVFFLVFVISLSWSLYCQAHTSSSNCDCWGQLNVGEGRRKEGRGVNLNNGR